MFKLSGFLNIKRYTVLIFAAFALGIVFSSNGGALKSFIPALIIFSALFIIVLYLIAKAEESNLPLSKIVVVVLIAAVSFSLGSLRYEHYDKSHTDALAQYEDSYAFVYGTVRSEPKLSNSGKSHGVVLDLYKIETSDGDFEISGRVSLYYSNSIRKIHRGDNICALSSIQLVPEYDDFDYRKYMKQKEIFYSLYSGFVSIDENYTAPFSLKNYICDIGLKINSSITSSIDKHFGNDELGAILKGIMIGDKSDFTDEMRSDFSKAGISHIAAVSGMHVSILFSALLLIFGIARIKKWVVCLITIPLLVLFAAAASFTPSVCRAVIMLILFLTAYLSRRNPDSITSMFFAGGVMLIFNPNYLFSVSFILSFASTAAILYLATPIAERLPSFEKLPRLGSYIKTSVSISVSSFLGICIPVAHFFNIVSLSSIVANLWVVPLVYLVFCGGYLLWILDFIFSPAAHLLKFILTPLISIIKSTSAYFSKVPFLVFEVPAPSVRITCLYFIFLFAFYVFLTEHTFKKK